MSDYLAVGGVTAVLKWLLSSELSASGPSTLLTAGTSITAVSPNLIATDATEEPRLNLFLYYVGLNPALRNLELPSRDASGNRVSSPPLALNLHYLVTAYGSTPGAQLTAEILLGWAVKVLHDNPVVPRSSIAAALADLTSAPSPSAEETLVGASTLAAQTELLRVTPESLTIEEIYRLWPAFQAPYRPSSAFQVSVVVIADGAVASAAPVQTPVIKKLLPQVPVT